MRSVVLALAASVVMAGCAGPTDDRAKEQDTSPATGAPRDAEECLRDADLSRQQAYPLRIAVPGGQAAMPKDRVTFQVCFERQYGAQPAHLVFRLNDVMGTVTPAELRVDSPEGAAHMVTVHAALEGGDGSLQATIDFGGPGEDSQTTQSVSVGVEVDGDVAQLTEK